MPQKSADQLLWQLDRAWALGLNPSWQSYLLDEADPQWPAHALKVCRIDLGWRVRRLATEGTEAAGAPVVGEYVSRLTGRVGEDDFRELAALEYQSRWTNCLPMDSAAFSAHLPAAWRATPLHVQWTCPDTACGAEDLPLAEGQIAANCPACRQQFALEQIFPRRSWWHDTNAPRWLLEELAGSTRQVGQAGTFGSAYLVPDHDAHGQLTVVKLLHQRWTENETVRARFTRESRILAQLDGQGTPALRRAGQLPDGRLYYQMQWIEGCELAKLVSTADVLFLVDRFEEVARAISTAHQQGILHRDLSPRNIVVDERHQRAVVLDWGQGRQLAKCAADNAAAPDLVSQPPDTPTASFEQVFGSPGFQAPELQGHVNEATPASDVFSLGSLLLYCLTRGEMTANGPSRLLGSPALSPPAEQGASEKARDALVKLRAGGTLAAEPELLDLCQACIERDPNRRPQSALAVTARLAAWRDARQRRLEILPLLRSKSRLAWSLLGVTIAATAVIGAVIFAWQQEKLQAERRLSSTREAARLEAAEFAQESQRLADEKIHEADKANSFALLMIELFKSADPIGLEGSGFRGTDESVQELTAVELLRRVSARVESGQSLSVAARAKVLDGVGDALRSLGDLDAAERLLRQAQQAQDQVAETPAQDKALLKFHLGMLFHDRRELDVAEGHYKQALDLLASLDASSESADLRAQIDFRYAWLLAEAQELDRATLLFQRVRDDRLRKLGPEHPATQAAELGLILVALPRLPTTEIIQRVAGLTATRSIVVEVLKGYLVASSLRRLGLLQQAKPAYESLLKRARAALPHQHLFLGMLIGDMAGLYHQCGELERALELAEEALVIARRTVPTHPYSIELYTKLAEEYERQGDVKKAIALYEELLGFLAKRQNARLDAARASIQQRLTRARSQLSPK